MPYLQCRPTHDQAAKPSNQMNCLPDTKSLIALSTQTHELRLSPDTISIGACAMCSAISALVLTLVSPRLHHQLQWQGLDFASHDCTNSLDVKTREEWKNTSCSPKVYYHKESRTGANYKLVSSIRENWSRTRENAMPLLGSLNYLTCPNSFELNLHHSKRTMKHLQKTSTGQVAKLTTFHIPTLSSSQILPGLHAQRKFGEGGVIQTMHLSHPPQEAKIQSKRSKKGLVLY